MNNDENERGKENAPGQNKEYTIYVNTREKQFTGHNIAFNDVVLLAFGKIETNPETVYTITYRKGDNNKPEGIMDIDDVIKVKNGMIFNATATNKS